MPCKKGKMPFHLVAGPGIGISSSRYSARKPPRIEKLEPQNLCAYSFKFSSKPQVVSVNLVIFGLTISSSWGNGHATLWRGLCNALSKHGHRVTFFERDVSYYAQHRDLDAPTNYSLSLYSDWASIRAEAQRAVCD